MINWHTKNINIQNYYKIMRRAIMLNGDNGRGLSGYAAWKHFKDNTTLHVFPADRLDEFRHFFAHLDVETAEGIAWGVTGQNEVYMFINDSRNSFIFRSNIMPFVHELLHVLYQQQVGTFHVTRLYDGAPEGRIGTRGSAATVIVHDNYYGSKERIRVWISWGIGWLPVSFPYIPIRKAKEMYPI
ncbi:hypothetical protein [Nitrosopumilus sp.]|uniref:hypothetical protein n=1 Tax=Nitrosopumilus sp. TaxID=2024843 RepID=UPI003D09B47C